LFSSTGRNSSYSSQKKDEGISERISILANYLPGAEKVINAALVRFKRREVKHDDILDSMVSAVTARFGKNRLSSLPEKPETDKTGFPMEIVYPEAS